MSAPRNAAARKQDAARQRLRYRDDPDSHKRAARRYYWRNRARSLARAREYKRQHRERLRAYQLAYRARNTYARDWQRRRRVALAWRKWVAVLASNATSGSEAMP